MNVSDSTDLDPSTGSVTLLSPQQDAEAAGVLRHFRWLGDEAEVQGDVSRTDAGLAITRVEVRATKPSGITHRHLHRVPLGDLLAAVRADLARYEKPASSTPLPPGRVLITDDLLSQVAMAYLEETGPGKDRAVLQRLEERFGRPKGTIRTWIKRAREEGWLEGAVQGRMGAAPGPKLLNRIGQAMQSPEMIEKEAMRIAQTLGTTSSDVVRGAMRAYNQHAEPAAVHEMRLSYGLPPLEACVAAQVTYGRSLAEELAERASTGIDEETALQEVGQQLRQALDGASGE